MRPRSSFITLVEDHANLVDHRNSASDGYEDWLEEWRVLLERKNPTIASPKSVYHLADKLRMTDLKEVAFDGTLPPLPPLTRSCTEQRTPLIASS